MERRTRRNGKLLCVTLWMTLNSSILSSRWYFAISLYNIHLFKHMNVLWRHTSLMFASSISVCFSASFALKTRSSLFMLGRFVPNHVVNMDNMHAIITNLLIIGQKIRNKFYLFRPSTTGLLSTWHHSCNAYLVTNCAEPTLKQKVVRVGVEAHEFVLLNSCLNYRIWLLGSSYSVSLQNKLSACEHERETLKGEKTELMHLHQQQVLEVQHQIEEKVGRKLVWIYIGSL